MMQGGPQTVVGVAGSQCRIGLTMRAATCARYPSSAVTTTLDAGAVLRNPEVVEPPIAAAPSGGDLHSTKHLREAHDALLSRLESLERQVDLLLTLQRNDGAALRREVDDVRCPAEPRASAYAVEAHDSQLVAHLNDAVMSLRGAAQEQEARIPKLMQGQIELQQMIRDATAEESDASEDFEDGERFLLPDDLTQILHRITALEASLSSRCDRSGHAARVSETLERSFEQIFERFDYRRSCLSNETRSLAQQGDEVIRSLHSRALVMKTLKQKRAGHCDQWGATSNFRMRLGSALNLVLSDPPMFRPPCLPRKHSVGRTHMAPAALPCSSG